MIISAVCCRGGRTENLDCIIELRDGNNIHAVLVVDAYGCTRNDVDRFVIQVKSLSVNDVSSACELLARINVDFNIKMAVVCIAKIFGRVSLSNLGDCRAYSQVGELLTLDHTIAWDDLVAIGVEHSKVAELVKAHPGRRVLKRFLKFPGGEHVAQGITIDGNNESNYLLCTDGFWSNVSQSILLSLASGATSVDEFSNELSSVQDNYTACLVRF